MFDPEVVLNQLRYSGMLETVKIDLVLSNHRKVALYLQEKREALKRKQELEEELIRAKIKVEMLKAERLRQGLSVPL